MPFRSLRHYIEVLEKENELTRVSEFVSPDLEITEIADRMVKNNGKALLFENTGTNFPVLINSMASDRRICIALGVDSLDDIAAGLTGMMDNFTKPAKGFMDKLRMLPALRRVSSWLPSSVNHQGVCQEIVMDTPDLTRLPVLTCWPFDGGPFITLPCVHTIDPETGLRNLGMYRMQVFGPTLSGMHWHMHKGSAGHYRKYKAMGKRMPVTVTLGGDPAYIYAATAPLPENIDEYILAGYFRKKRVELVKCLTNELRVPSDVDFVIEGYVDPDEELILEGPFGDHTGFYSLADYYPRFHVTCITHRRDAVYPATIVGIPPQEDGWIGKATERIFLMPVRMTVAPEIEEMHMPVEGVFHNITLVSIRNHYPGQAIKVMSSMWGAGQMMFNKIMAVFSAGQPLDDYIGLARTLSSRCHPVRDIHMMHGPVDILDHASHAFAIGSKIGFDATGSAEEIIVPGIDPGISEHILKSFPEVASVNLNLLNDGISCLIIAIRKEIPGVVRNCASELIGKLLKDQVKFVIFMDEATVSLPFGRLVWLAANNIDPARDCFYVNNEQNEPFSVLCIDGTTKISGLDNFNRDWPNVILMDDDTITKVDARWDKLGLGPFIPSPSIEVRDLVSGGGAVAYKR